MAKKGSIVFFLSFIVAISALVTFQYPTATKLSEPTQTEIVVETDDAQEVQPEISGQHVVKRYNILRWRNHTINLHLRNVRSKWLTFITPQPHQPITYPEEDSRI
jgi:hypothetical protein